MMMRVGGSYRFRNSVARSNTCCLKCWGVCELVDVVLELVV